MTQNRSTPRWVKISVIVIIILILLLVILHFSGGGFGPHMHGSALEYGIRQPWS